jgi:hypothetical protein
MARFLTREWFNELPAAGVAVDERAQPDLVIEGPDLVVEVPDLVIEVAVSGAPDGDVRYQVVVWGERATVVSDEAAFRPAQVEMKTDYATMAGIACGKLSALDVLSAGQARVSGDLGELSAHQSSFSDLDLVPAATRATTTY